MSDSKLKISDDERNLIDRIKKHVSVSAEGVGESSEAFRITATEDGRDVDRMIDDKKYQDKWRQAAHVAVGELSHQAFLAYKDLNTSTVSFDMAGDSLEVAFTKHQRVPNRIIDKESGHPKVDGERDLYGGSTLKYIVQGVKNSAGRLKHQREHFHELFEQTAEFKTAAFSS